MAKFSLISGSRGRILTHSMHDNRVSQSQFIMCCMLHNIHPAAATGCSTTLPGSSLVQSFSHSSPPAVTDKTCNQP